MKCGLFCLASVLVELACGSDAPSDFEPSGICQTSIGPFFLQSRRSCDAYEALLGPAQHLLDESGIIPSYEFAAAAPLGGIWVYAGEELPIDGRWDIVGQYDYQRDRIYVSRCPGALVHEMEHRWQMLFLGDTAEEALSHARWNEAGGFRPPDENFSYHAGMFGCPAGGLL